MKLERVIDNLGSSNEREPRECRQPDGVGRLGAQREGPAAPRPQPTGDELRIKQIDRPAAADRERIGIGGEVDPREGKSAATLDRLVLTSLRPQTEVFEQFEVVLVWLHRFTVRSRP